MTTSIGLKQPLTAFDWSVAERALGWHRGEPMNIGWYCSDRICRIGGGARRALIWEDARGQGRTYTFDDLRVLSNTIAEYLLRLGVTPARGSACSSTGCRSCIWASSAS